MYKQPPETNNCFSLRCSYRRVFRIKNSLLRHFNEISAYFCFFCFALLTQLSVMMTADNRNLIIPRGVRPDYLFLIVSLKRRELHSRANGALSLLLSDTQLKNIQSFLYTENDSFRYFYYFRRNMNARSLKVTSKLFLYFNNEI